MGHAWRWFEGSTDPVDCAVRNVEPQQVRDPRAANEDGQVRQLLIADDYEVQGISDPLQLMLDCERLDEVAGVGRGTHYDELCRRFRVKS